MRWWILALLAACSDGSAPLVSEPDLGTAIDAALVDTAPRCAGKPSVEPDKTWTLSQGALLRRFDVHLPAGYDATRPMPVVLNFHGNGSNAAQQRLVSRMNAGADRDGYIAVYPEGATTPQSWNAGVCCAAATTLAIDDVGFVGLMLDALERDLCVDGARVYATGLSNGAFLSHRLACELGHRIAAIAPVAGVLGVSDCRPRRPMPLLHIHGLADTVVPYAGAPLLGFSSVDSSYASWGTLNGCTTPAVEISSQGEARCVARGGCAAATVLCTITNGGHTWPGGVPLPIFGHTTTDLDATAAMWQFFSQQRL